VQTPRLGDWVPITADGRVLVRSGKVELGQGITTALAQIVADELDVDLARVTLQPTRTGSSPDEGLTSGSMSVQHSGDALREVCARVRAIYLAEASTELGRRPDELTVVDGEIRADYGGFVSYWSLADDALLDVAIGDAPDAPVKDPGGYREVGRSAPRVDGAGKIFGQPSYIHDLRLPGQLFGRVVRPPARVATLRSVDDAAVGAMDGVVQVVRDGDFLAVIADDEATAVAACRTLAAACTWDVTDSLPDQSALDDYLLSAPSVAETLYQREQPAAEAARTVTRRFSRGFVEHASLAPSCGVAVWEGDDLQVWSHSQGIYRLRKELAREFGMPEERIVVTHAEGAGCYGHNAADDAALDAALLARRVPGRPVHVVWSRQDEHVWEPFGPAMVTEIQVSLDASAEVTTWRQDVWSNGHVSRPSSDGLPPLLSAQYRADRLPPVAAGEPSFKTGGGMSRNMVPLYDFPSVTAVTHRLTEMPLRTSALRALGAHLNVYAIESVIDELAAEAGQDPIAYRLDRLADERARAVLEAVAERSGWGTPLAGGADVGRGVGFARYKNAGGYCAVVAEVEAETEVRVRRLTIAVDVGLIVNPDGVRNQIEGGAIQAVSWTTLEQVRFDRAQVTSQDWESYPILRFEQVPAVDVVLLSRPDLPTLGSGEMAAGPTAAAIGNALADALGVRVPTLPLTPANIVAAMA
jgi:CO/xanthine dehydrogenase Mo-binding subunit